jgi:uncharacterized protein YggE
MRPTSLLLVAHLFLSVAGTAVAGTARADASPRLITVTGDADVRVAPDEVNITLGVETSDKDLPTAARKNAEQVRLVLAMAKEFKIDAKDIGSDQISIEKQMEYVNNKNQFKEYLARRTVSLRLKDISRFEDLLLAAMKGGATSLHGVQFCTSQLRKYRDQARANAIRAASEKAADMAKLLAQKVGKPNSITENFDGWSIYSGSRGAMYGNSQVTSQAPASGGSDSPGVGLITVNAKVTVAFELE